MAELKKIKEVPINKLKTYANNSKTHSNKQIELIARSIEEFGFLTPCLIDMDYNVVAGHGRIMAAKHIGRESVPCVFIDGLSDAQKRAYVIADNKLTELGRWNKELLGQELETLVEEDFDIDLTGFDLDDVSKIADELTKDIDSWYGDERERTNKAYNLDIVDHSGLTADWWQMPIIRSENYIPQRMIGFNYAKTSDDKKACIHFFVDDYQFERVWNSPEKYTEVLKEYECILTPDFSLYMDMPRAMKVWNVYRSRQIGAYYQSQGVRVIPTISWAEPETYDFCFRGVPIGSVVAVSSVGVKEDANALEVWRDGMAEMIRQIKPSVILLYGGEIDFDYGGIEVVNYKNEVLEKWKNGRKRRDE